MDVTGTHDGLIKLGSPASHAGNRGSIPRGGHLFLIGYNHFKILIKEIFFF